MNCPKTLRNGPCGGVRENGHCEVKPEMKCVWLKAYDRTQDWPLPTSWKDEYNHLRPPVDNRLKGTSSWKNFFTNEIAGLQLVGRTQLMNRLRKELIINVNA